MVDHGKSGQNRGARLMPIGDGTMAPSLYPAGAELRIRLLSRRRLSSRSEPAGVVPDGSTSSAKASKRCPDAVRKSIAAIARRCSRRTSRSGGRYHATTRIPRACAATRKRATCDGR